MSMLQSIYQSFLRSMQRKQELRRMIFNHVTGRNGGQAWCLLTKIEMVRKKTAAQVMVRRWTLMLIEMVRKTYDIRISECNLFRTVQNSNGKLIEILIFEIYNTWNKDFILISEVCSDNILQHWSIFSLQAEARLPPWHGTLKNLVFWPTVFLTTWYPLDYSKKV